MYSSADYSITPRPIYCADGKKVFDVQTWPMELRDEIKEDLGNFPFPSFWGPNAGLPSTEWISQAAQWFEQRFSPDLNLVYLPHLDYNLQRHGPDDSLVTRDIQEIDQIVGELIDFFEAQKVQPILISEYGITPVDRPIHINREFRSKGWISCRDELGKEQIDLGNCQAFAIADHQLAHIYINDPSIEEEVKVAISQLSGVKQLVVGEEGLKKIGLDHKRSGDLVAISDDRSWFTYYYWEDNRVAPDYARCVDIHRKPGYDPVELFVDPAISNPKLRVASKLLKKKLGFRMLMDLIPLDANLVKGSHGCVPESTEDYPVLIGQFPSLGHEGAPEPIAATDIRDLLFLTATGE